MAVFGRIRRRLALAIVVTALIPVLVAVLLAESMVRQTSARFYVPEIGTRLDQSLELYQELARSVKTSMRHAAAAIAADQELREAAGSDDAARAQRRLDTIIDEYPGVVDLVVFGRGEMPLATARREKPLDPNRENKLEVVRSLAAAEGGSAEAPPEADEVPEAGPRLVAVFAADKARFDELESMSEFVDAYKEIDRRRQADEMSYVYGFALLLGITIVAAIGVGALFARGVSSRLGELARATQRVGAGDLSIRVPEHGTDEIADLAGAFNRMVGEVENSRARIEYLQRVAAWQEMARRLAHEIKNPLTPIQLAVQEIHRRYKDGDATYRKLLDSTLEIVEDEVGTLRRLVSEFSDFARLPRAELEECDLAEFLQEQGARGRLIRSDDGDELASDGDGVWPGIHVHLALPARGSSAPVYLDRQMFRRAMINLVRNAAQAITAARGSGTVRIGLERERDTYLLNIDDDGPGIAPDLQASVFDPYVTTKPEGTGLGLAIVKKIVIEHGGTVHATTGPLGGARVQIRLPVRGTPASLALKTSPSSPPPSSSSKGTLRVGRTDEP